MAIVAFAGGLVVADQNIEGQKEQALADFQRDQRQQHYSEILQQATRLHNAGDASSSALSAGLFSTMAGMGVAAAQSGATTAPAGTQPGTLGTGGPLTGSEPADEPDKYGNPYVKPSYSNVYPYPEPPRGASWQDAYTALDQAISNAEIASDDGVIALARALRDRYRADYYESVMKNIDSIVAAYRDPKPDKAKLADALVGVPADRLPPTYDPGILSKSTDELTAMYADAAKLNLGITDDAS